jgi:hypothetical protein
VRVSFLAEPVRAKNEHKKSLPQSQPRMNANGANPISVLIRVDSQNSRLFFFRSAPISAISGEMLLALARIVLRIDVIELHRRRAVNLDYHFPAAGHRVMMNVRIQVGKTAGV